MRFVTFCHQGQKRAGVLLATEPSGLQILDGAHPERPLLLQKLEPNMSAWLRHGLQAISESVRRCKVHDDALIPLEHAQLCSPLPSQSGKIVGAAFNYRDGLALGTRAAPEEPIIFIKSSSTVVGPGEPVRIPTAADCTYEAELAVVIGRQALKVHRSEAMEYVAGYTLFNDVSASRYVREDQGFVRGKNQPASGPLGPWIVLPSDVPDPYDLPISLKVDDRILQASNTAQMLHRIDVLIEYISAQMPLDVGDVIATGTPAGVASHHRPATWLRPGQEISIQMTSWFGELTNPVLSIQ